MSKRIGILTGGGDVPGLNSVIKAVVYRASEQGKEVVGIKKGWEGLTHMTGPDDSNYIWPLDRETTRTIDRTGGTALHSSRTNPSRMSEKALPGFINKADLEKYRKNETTWDLTPVVLENLEKLGVDTLITIGGDDTLSYSARLHSEGFPVIAIPKTMDNDVRNTEYCIGFATAITRAKDAINRQRTTVGSHERVGIFRIFGRDAGFTSLYTSYIAATRCLIPEVRFDLDKLCNILVEDRDNNPSNYSIVVISEGAAWDGYEVKSYGEADAYGHRKKVNIGESLSEEFKKRTGLETVVSDLTYDLRSGEPDAVDHMVAITFANIAIDMLNDGVSGKMMGIKDGKYAAVEIPDPKMGPRTVDIERLYNLERYRPRYNNKIGAPLMLESVV
jgi:ATP-dependent phosphofructokinase / diphosphate-dependent phosphofructokinase